MEKIQKILIGTHNKGKIKEISYLLNKKIQKISPFDLNIKSPKETGKSFKANSVLKAKYFFKKSKITTISDDSGLCIECLKNKPGIYSARWAKKYGSFYNAMKKIIELVEKKNKSKKLKNTKAKFVCSLTLYFNNKKITTVGEISGNITNRIVGKNGFGYDSIFIPGGHKLTFGQMSKKKKILSDHRFIAFSKLKKKINIL
ncbi:RdgB/HAM1 family non-canonical purine NTP pyrophosphatase [Pelagibacteraceae bacterium]|jgi:XTP/dITP diphosphohydrolase|nr:RdgB/HAM1 family non-canonical purine NTP pyrophosphatase [Pelagibacteraceae bacterium]